MIVFRLTYIFFLISIVTIGCVRKTEVPQAKWTFPLTTSSEEAKVLFKKGLYWADFGLPDSSFISYERATRLDSSFALAYLGMAQSSTSTFEFLRYLDKAEQLSSTASEEEQLLIEITKLDFEKNSRGKSARIRRLIELSSDNPRAWLAFAEVQADRGLFWEANESNRYAIRLDTTFVPSLVHVGKTFLKGASPNSDSALYYIQQAIHKVPDEGYPYFLKGDILMKQGHLIEAQQAYLQSELKGYNPLELQLRLAHLAFLDNELDSAKERYSFIVAHNRGQQKLETLKAMARIMLYLGDPIGAIDSLRSIYENIEDLALKDPLEMEVSLLRDILLITVHYRLYDQMDEALLLWKSAMRKLSTHVEHEAFHLQQVSEVAFMEALVEVSKGSLQEAQGRTYEISIFTEEESGRFKSSPIFQLMGFISLERGRFAEAANYLQETNYNQSPYILFMLGEIYQKMGRQGEALRFYQEARNWRVDNIEYALIYPELEFNIRQLSN